MNEGLENNTIQQKEEKNETYGIVKLHVFVHSVPKIKLQLPYKGRFKISAPTKYKKGGYNFLYPVRYDTGKILGTGMNRVATSKEGHSRQK
jgi:hypothetical protein